MKMKKLIQLLLYCVASAGILINLFFHIKVVGFIGYKASHSGAPFVLGGMTWAG